jgi:hypothetical protein
MEAPKLSTALYGKYKMAAGLNPGRYSFADRTIDTTVCSLEQADEMVKLGFKELVPVEPEKEAKPKK